ncbi:MAG: hypothetical protein FWC28_09340, partial [Proteobacteria bacterium]|nr:hypothetical protein [Pseudomonadota bacterium]
MNCWWTEEEAFMHVSSFRRWLFFGFALLSAAAVAQSVELSIDNNKERKVVGHSACSTRFDVRWDFSEGYSACGDLRIWASTQASCETEEGEVQTVAQDTLNASYTSTVAMPLLRDWPGFGGVACGEEGGAGRNVSHRICATFSVEDAANDCVPKTVKNKLSLIYKTTPPQRPEINDAKGYDGEINIRFSVASSDYVDRVVLYRKHAGGGDEEIKTTHMNASTSATFRVSGFENSEYSFCLRAIDEAGNVSECRDLDISIFPTYGFWEIYKARGGGGGG